MSSTTKSNSKAASTGSTPGLGRMPATLSQADSQRIAGYKAYLDFYNGYHWEGLPAPSEKRLTFNYARIFVHKAASYLIGKGTGFAVGAPHDAGERGTATAHHAESLLQACYERNSLALADLDTAVDSAVLCDGAFKVTWDTESSAPSVSPVDPASIVCVRRSDDIRRLLAVQQTYHTRGVGGQSPGISEASGYGLPAGGKVTEVWTADTLEIWRDGDLVQRVPNPYGIIPYIVFPNLRVPKEPWGQSDLVDLISINRDLNSRLSILSHILEVSGNPIAVLENVASADGIKVGPGRRDVCGHAELTAAGNHTPCPGGLLGWVQAFRED